MAMSPEKVVTRIGIGLLAQMILYQLFGVLALSLVYLLVPADIAQADWMLWACNYVPYYLIAMPAMLLIFRTVPNSETAPQNKRRLTVKHFLLLLLACWGISGVLGGMSNLLLMLIEAVKGAPLSSMENLEAMMEQPWLYLLISTVCAPLVEEYVFRYLFFKKLARFGGKSYVFFSAFAFALSHANFSQLLYAFAIGLVLATLYYFTRNVGYVVALHMSFNFFGGAVLVFLNSYAGTTAVMVWSLLTLRCITAGCIIGISWWKRHKQDIFFSPGEAEITKKMVLRSPGMVLFMVVIAALTIVGIVM